MTNDAIARTPTAHCPRCGESSAGHFCTGCGSALRDVTCPQCGTPITAGARFCAECGASAGAGGTPTARRDQMPRLIGGIALVALVAFVGGIITARRGSEPVASDAMGAIPQGASLASADGNGGIVPAPDISAMSPQERASRLFNRVMLYSEQGKRDSAQFFAPMAIQAYEMLGPVDAHTQYDIGVISAAAGDLTRAKAEADTILAARPTHLLGLVLAIRAAKLSNDEAAVARYQKRLVAAAPTERSALKEYAEHSRDIDDALAKASGK